MEQELGNIFIRWYKEHCRDLPWRKTKDPYLIWISEIILQQTRVVQGLDYYYRFVERFPDVCTLASASEDEVMRYWQGLGYYSRARYLHEAAKEILSRYGGVFPRTREEILSLKGIGEYTAAAVCSFAYKQPYVTVDGNVFRVLSRLFDIDIPINTGEGKKFFTELAQHLLVLEHPDLFNQAVMEFGALQCVPKNPDCLSCPFVDKCLAFSRNRVVDLPVKKGKTLIKSRYFNYLHIHDGRGNCLLQQRRKDDIWCNLYEFPLWETDHLMGYEELVHSDFFQQIFNKVECLEMVNEFRPRKHILSHRVIHSVFYEIKVSDFSENMDHFIRVAEARLEEYAISRLMQIYWEYYLK